MPYISESFKELINEVTSQVRPGFDADKHAKDLMNHALWHKNHYSYGVRAAQKRKEKGNLDMTKLDKAGENLSKLGDYHLNTKLNAAEHRSVGQIIAKHIQNDINESIEVEDESLIESYEHLDEVSGGLLGRYIQKARQDISKKSTHSKELDNDPKVKKLDDKITNWHNAREYTKSGDSVHRTQINNARQKIIDRKKEIDPQFPDSVDTGKRRKGIDRAIDKLKWGKMTSEETELEEGMSSHNQTIHNDATTAIGEFDVIMKGKGYKRSTQKESAMQHIKYEHPVTKHALTVSTWHGDGKYGTGKTILGLHDTKHKANYGFVHEFDHTQMDRQGNFSKDAADQHLANIKKIRSHLLASAKPQLPGVKEETELDEANSTHSQLMNYHRNELNNTSKKIDDIVKNGGRVDLKDPLSIKLKKHAAMIKQLKSNVNEETDPTFESSFLDESNILSSRIQDKLEALRASKKKDDYDFSDLESAEDRRKKAGGVKVTGSYGKTHAEFDDEDAGNTVKVAAPTAIKRGRGRPRKNPL